MNKDELKKIPAKSIAELRQLIQTIQKEMVDLRMQKALNKNKNVREYKLKRQLLARVKTILSEKKLIDENPKP